MYVISHKTTYKLNLRMRTLLNTTFGNYINQQKDINPNYKLDTEYIYDMLEQIIITKYRKRKLERSLNKKEETIKIKINKL